MTLARKVKMDFEVALSYKSSLIEDRKRKCNKFDKFCFYKVK